MVNLIEKQSAGLFSGEQLAVRLFTPIRSARGKGISLTAVSDKGAALDPDCPKDNLPFFYEKEGTENGFAILSGVTVVTVTLGQKKPVIT